MNQRPPRQPGWLAELLEDYRDHLRTDRFDLWSKDSKEAIFVRNLGATKNANYDTFKRYIDNRPANVMANILVCLIHQTKYLLDQQLRNLEQVCLKGGLAVANEANESGTATRSATGAAKINRSSHRSCTSSCSKRIRRVGLIGPMLVL